MAEMMKLYGNYRARVENNGRDKNLDGKSAVADPENRLRVQVRVLGVHTFTSGEKQLSEQADSNTDDVIPIKHLPWCERAMPLIFNESDDYVAGIQGIPGVGSWVWVFFEQGDPMSPVYFAGMIGKGKGDYFTYSRKDVFTLLTKAGHTIEINDSMDDSGNPTGCIYIRFKNSTSDDVAANQTIFSLSKDLISMQAKTISIGATDSLALTGATAASLNGAPIVTSSGSTQLALENIQLKAK